MSSAKSDLIDAKESYQETLKLSTDLRGLKEVYRNKSKTQKELQKILIQPSLKSALIEQNMKKSGATLSSDSMGLDELNLLMGKLLNGTYNITSLKVKRLSETKVSFFMEIVW